MMREDWVEINLGEVCKIIAGTGFPKNIQGKKKGEFPFYKVGDISNNVKAGNRYLQFSDNYVDSSDIKNISSRIVPSESIVFAKIGEALKLNRRAITSTECLVDNNAIGLKAEKEICYLYLYFFFLTIKLEKFSRATTVPSVRKSDIETISFPLSPLPEQQAIVSKIEELFSDLDKGIADLKTAQEQLKMYRQAVLKKAFEGELTKEWREKQSGLPSAQNILNQINEEYQLYYEEKVDHWSMLVHEWKENGKEGKKPVKPKQKVELPDDCENMVCPDIWKILKIGYLLSLDRKGMTTGPFGTLLKKSEHQAEGIPVLGIENIGEGIFRMPNKIFVTKEKATDLKSFEVQLGDIIISRSGTVGEICAVTKDIGLALISTNLMRVSLNKKAIDSKYFVYLFQGGEVREQVKKLCTGSTRDFLNQTILSSVNFPIPSLKEQKQIVCEIESRLSVCDQVEDTIKESLGKSEALRQSILKKAFEGNLLNKSELYQCRQADDYEPAQLLLERIKVENN